MALSHSPKIVTDGLVLCLDAGNPKSYFGSGTTWSDLSGNGNNGTLTNGPTYSSSNGGSFVFDGVNDYVNLGDLDIATSLTISVWFKGNATQPNSFAAIISKSPQGFMGNYAFIGDSGSNRVRFGFTNTSFTNITTFNSSYNDIKANTWVNYTGTYDFSNLRLYRNGVEIASTPETSTPLLNDNITSIGYRVDGGVGAFSGSVSNFLIYNRALTASEIQQNFNALRGRFSI